MRVVIYQQHSLLKRVFRREAFLDQYCIQSICVIFLKLYMRKTVLTVLKAKLSSTELCALSVGDCVVLRMIQLIQEQQKQPLSYQKN